MITQSLSDYVKPTALKVALGVAAALVARRLYRAATAEDPKYVKPARFIVPESRKYKKQEQQKESESATENKFLVVGSGFVGLGLAAGLVRYDIDFDIVEKEDALGGNWNYGVYDTVHIISSKLTTEYKDYPMPDEYPTFPSKDQMLSYFKSYAEHWGLASKVQYGVEVVRCEPVEDPSSTSPSPQSGWRRSPDGSFGWRVVLKDLKSGKQQERTYKGLVLALGHHSCRRFCSYPGQEDFAGKLIHSKDYHTPLPLLGGQRVLVVGGGNSACDIAVEAARFAKSSTISLRRGYWFVPRLFRGYPVVEWMTPKMPYWAQPLLFRFVAFLTVGDYRNYGLELPDHAPLEHHPVINSDLLHHIRLGSIAPRRDIRRFCGGKEVEFVDGTKEEFDLVISCTGFNYSVPMLRPALLPFADGIPQLYGGSVPDGLVNCFVTVGGQPRYGAGPLISLGSHVLAESIIAQEKLKYPLGTIYKAAGVKTIKKSAKTSGDVLSNPFESWDSMNAALVALPTMGRVVKYLEWRGKLNPSMMKVSERVLA